MARNPKYCPLNYDDWRKIPQEYKDDMLDHVKSRFILETTDTAFIHQSINDKWRKWKSRVKNSNFKTDVSVEQQIADLPNRVDPKQYKGILEYWCSEKYKKFSEKNKETRAKLTDIHHTGQRSFAVTKEIMREELGRYPTRAEIYEKCYLKDGSATSNIVVREEVEKMKELADENPYGSVNDNIVYERDDEFSKVKGQDKDGQVRMYGMGVKARDIYGTKPSRAALLRENMKYKKALETLTMEVEKLKERDHDKSNNLEELEIDSDLDMSLREPNSPFIAPASQNNRSSSAATQSTICDPQNNRESSIIATQPTTRASQNNHESSTVATLTTTRASQRNRESLTTTTQGTRIRVGSYVVLKSLVNENEIVATGILREIGGVRVNGITLGSAFCNVVVQFILKEDENLAFPHGDTETIGESIGAPVAWPFTSIALDKDMSFD